LRSTCRRVSFLPVLEKSSIDCPFRDSARRWRPAYQHRFAAWDRRV
jgi:hypothetical protein